MAERQTFSTAGVEPRHKLDLWRSMLADSWAPLEIKNCQSLDFDAECISTTVDNRLTIVQTSLFSSRIVRPKSFIRKDQVDHFSVGIMLEGSAQYSHNGYDDTVAPGTFFLHDLSRTSDYTIIPRNLGANTPAATVPRALNIVFPRKELERILGPSQNPAGLLLGPNQASTKLIICFFHNLFEQAHLLDPATAARMVTIGLDLLSAGFAERLALEPKQGPSAAALVYRAKALLEDRLWDTGLDTASIAAAVGLSVRRLQEVFAGQELTVDGYLWDRRLARASMQLRDPAYDGTSIASIAYGAGFVSAPHFARRFAQRYAMTPSEYRVRRRLDRFVSNVAQ